jgi:hypothetical protein
MRAVRESGATLLPIDSEHNAIFQSLPSNYSGDLATAACSACSSRLRAVRSGSWRLPNSLGHPEQACAHPNWVMGRKISVDSATMMNKGLEVIEAHWLFNVPADRIQVVIHPQSVIHSLVQYADGSVIAELGNPDMRTPIAHALAYPRRIAAGVEPLDLYQVASLHFERPDLSVFPCLALAYRALGEGGCAPTTLNAANEVAVEAFLERRIGFTAIPRSHRRSHGPPAGGRSPTRWQMFWLPTGWRAQAAEQLHRRWASRMSGFLYYLAAFAVALGILVVVHEFGHYLAARWVGVKVLRFSVGFGRPLWCGAWAGMAPSGRLLPFRSAAMSRCSTSVKARCRPRNCTAASTGSRCSADADRCRRAGGQLSAGHRALLGPLLVRHRGVQAILGAPAIASPAAAARARRR